jgi:hypothetical protein
MLVSLALFIAAPMVTFTVGAVAAVAARVAGGSRGIMGYVLGPLTLIASMLPLLGGALGALAGLSAATFAAGAVACGFTARPLLAHLRLMPPARHYSNWS